MPDQSDTPPVVTSTSSPQRPREISVATRRNLSFFVSLFVGFYFAEGLLSLWDDTFRAFGFFLLTPFRALFSWGLVLTSGLLYLTIAFVPALPKRVILPLAGMVLGSFCLIPLTMTFPQEQLVEFAILLGVLQLGIGILAVRQTQGAWRVSWPLCPVEHIRPRRFSWTNLILFAGANVLVVIPGLAAYAGLCASLAVGRLSQGFMALRSDSLTVQARTYKRDDGKTIHLVPMMHVADAGFYREISSAFPSNSVVLLEGVTDRKHLLKEPLSYKKMAESLGVAEQHDAFEPARGDARPADVDIEQFSPSTLAFLRKAIRFHADPFNVENLREMFQTGESPEMVQALWDDILFKRNANLLEHVKTELKNTDRIAIPWGALHMPGLAASIQREGFHLSETREYQVLNFAKSLRAIASRQK